MKLKASDSTLPAQSFKWKTAHSGELQYLLYLPRDHRAKRSQRWPLLLFLHGAGERGKDVQRAGIHGPMSLVRQGTNFPFIIMAPLCPEGQQWENEPLLQLLDHAVKKFSVATNRVYLTGLSMGGYGAWRLALDQPERFAAVVPICGGGNLIDVILGSRNRTETLRTLPVWVFHGARDNVVPPDESERMVEALRKIGAKEVKLTIYPHAGHDSWTETYNNPEFYRWLLQHKR
jgi:predicted peptidase